MSEVRVKIQIYSHIFQDYKELKKIIHIDKWSVCIPAFQTGPEDTWRFIVVKSKQPKQQVDCFVLFCHQSNKYKERGHNPGRLAKSLS